MRRRLLFGNKLKSKTIHEAIVGDILVAKVDNNKKIIQEYIINYDTWLKIAKKTEYIAEGIVCARYGWFFNGIKILSLTPMCPTNPDKGKKLKTDTNPYFGYYNSQQPLFRNRKFRPIGTIADGSNTDVKMGSSSIYLHYRNVDGTINSSSVKSTSIDPFENSTKINEYVKDEELKNGYTSSCKITNKYWYKQQYNNGFDTENAFSDWWGLANTTIMANVYNTAQKTTYKTSTTITNGSGDGYTPAACCCLRYCGELSENKELWFLPGAGEMSIAVEFSSVINNVLTNMEKNTPTTANYTVVAQFSGDVMSSTPASLGHYVGFNISHNSLTLKSYNMQKNSTNAVVYAMMNKDSLIGNDNGVRTGDKLTKHRIHVYLTDNYETKINDYVAYYYMNSFTSVFAFNAKANGTNMFVMGDYKIPLTIGQSLLKLFPSNSVYEPDDVIITTDSNNEEYLLEVNVVLNNKTQVKKLHNVQILNYLPSEIPWVKSKNNDLSLYHNWFKDIKVTLKSVPYDGSSGDKKHDKWFTIASGKNVMSSSSFASFNTMVTVQDFMTNIGWTNDIEFSEWYDKFGQNAYFNIELNYGDRKNLEITDPRIDKKFSNNTQNNTLTVFEPVYGDSKFSTSHRVFVKDLVKNIIQLNGILYGMNFYFRTYIHNPYADKIQTTSSTNFARHCNAIYGVDLLLDGNSSMIIKTDYPDYSRFGTIYPPDASVKYNDYFEYYGYSWVSGWYITIPITQAEKRVNSMRLSLLGSYYSSSTNNPYSNEYKMWVGGIMEGSYQIGCGSSGDTYDYFAFNTTTYVNDNCKFQFGHPGEHETNLFTLTKPIVFDITNGSNSNIIKVSRITINYQMDVYGNY